MNSVNIVCVTRREIWNTRIAYSLYAMELFLNTLIDNETNHLNSYTDGYRASGNQESVKEYQ